MEPAVLAVLDLVLERAPVVEVLGCLDEGDPRVVEIAQGSNQEVRVGHVVGVEHGHQVGVDDAEGVVQVARLGMLVGPACKVACAELLGHPLDIRAIAIVEDPRLVLDAHRQRRCDRRQEDLAALVVGRDQDGHAMSGHEGGCDRRPNVEVPERHGEEEQTERGMDLEDVERHGEPCGARVQREEAAPRQVGDAHRERRDSDRADECPAARRLAAGKGGIARLGGATRSDRAG